ncbi:MAG TPA: efflux RND transporter permease subunit [Bacteroidales bacterium]|nr:efflux RND transporter permease subunit [Bacteroidales bacterium]
MAGLILKYRWIIISLSVMAGVAFGLLIPSAETDPEIRNYVPRSMTSRVATDSIEQQFGVQDMIVALYTDTSVLTTHDLRQIKDVDRAFKRLEGLGTINSLYTARNIRGEDGMMIVDPLVSKIPETEEEIAELKKNILSNQFARDVVVSSDFTAAAITGTINPGVPENVTLGKIDSIIASSGEGGVMLTGGLPYIRRFIVEDVNHDAMVLIPLALIIMLTILKVTLGDWKSVLMPFSVVVLSTAVSMGLIPLFGWKISILSLLVPIIMISVANNYGIYLVTRYQELCRSDIQLSSKEMIHALTGSLNMPILFSGLTTVAGILGLLAHSIIPARQLGVLAAIGVSIALAMSLLFIPAMISFRKPVKKIVAEPHESGGVLNRTISGLSKVVLKWPGRVLVISAAITLLTSSGIFLLKTDTNQENYFPHKHPVRKASEIINAKFGGSQTISVMVRGDIKDPLVMRGINDLTLHLKSVEGVGNVFSISGVVREMSKALYEPGEPEYDQIPASGNAIAQMFELYNMSGDPDDFSQLMNFENTGAHILIRLSKPDNDIIRAVREDIERFTSDFPARITVGGYAIIMADFARKIINGQLSSLFIALLTVFMLLSLIFRSVKGGLIGSIPLAASIIIQFGFMGMAGIAIDAATALLSSIMIGVGVDFTIQFMWRYNFELRNGLSHREAILKTYGTTGRSIIINAMSVMAGFSATFFSGFLSIRFFGYMVLLSIGSCLLFSIIVIPAFLLKFKPAFIEADLSHKINKKIRNEKDVVNVSIGSLLRRSHGTTA